LPDKVERVVKCELSVWQKMVYKQVQQKFIPMATSTSGVSAKGLNNTFMQLRKICNHPYLFFDDINYNWDSHRITDEIVRCSGKFEILERMLPKIRRSNHKVLIFTQMTKVLDIMEDYMDYRRYPYLRLDGQTKPETRSQLLELFNAPNSPYFVFLLSTRAGGLGLNLQSADTVIIFDSDWNPQMDLQAQDRAHRLGQQSEVRVFRLVTCSPVEEQILMRAQFKLGLDQMIIQAGKFNQKDSLEATAQERREMLTTVLRDGVEMGEQVDLPSDDKINSLLARSEDELDLFQLIDVELDKERRDQWRAAGRTDPLPPRLMMDETEVPGYIRQAQAALPPVKFDVTQLEGARGARKESAPVYREMTDAEFDALCEDEEAAPADSATASKTPRKGKRPANSSATKKTPLQSSLLAVLNAMKSARSDAFAALAKAPASADFRDVCAPDTAHLDLKAIFSNVRGGKYTRPGQMARDFRLMLQNFELWFQDSVEGDKVRALRKLFNEKYRAAFQSDEKDRVKTLTEDGGGGSETESGDSDADLGLDEDDDDFDDDGNNASFEIIDDDDGGDDDEDDEAPIRTVKRRKP